MVTQPSALPTVRKEADSLQRRERFVFLSKKNFVFLLSVKRRGVFGVTPYERYCFLGDETAKNTGQNWHKIGTHKQTPSANPYDIGVWKHKPVNDFLTTTLLSGFVCGIFFEKWRVLSLCSLKTAGFASYPSLSQTVGRADKRGEPWGRKTPPDTSGAAACLF